uniref:F-box domain-containing protein n=1 Tax=Triticum urartu TaxID=4572 RepID=A0A8R7V306_TRIUA
EPADGDAASGTISGLPFHLTEEILCRISPLESVRLAAVCRSWAATVSERLARPTPHLLALKVLLGPTSSTCSTQQRRRGAIFSLLIDQEESPAPVMPARLPAAFSHATGDIELSGALPCGDFSFVEDNRVVLVNPVTGTLQSIEMYGPRQR